MIKGIKRLKSIYGNVKLSLILFIILNNEYYKQYKKMVEHIFGGGRKL